MDLTTAKAFVTGGSGFVGRALISALHAKGAQVVALARSQAAAAKVIEAGATPAMGELSDQDALRTGMAGCSVVFHAAAEVSDWGPRARFYEVTVRGTERALAAARDAGAAKFVHIGTEAVLAAGAPIVDADETAPYPAKPLGLYPWSKGLAERAVIAANGDGLTTVSVRPRLIWGKGDTTILPQVADAMRRGVFVWFGNGHHPTSTCHVRNDVEGTLLAAERGEGGNIYFLTDGPPVDFRDFITEMAATQGAVAPTRCVPLWVAHGVALAGEAVWGALNLAGRPMLTRTAINVFFMQVTVNDQKARERLGYRALVTRAQGLAEMRAVV